MDLADLDTFEPKELYACRRVEVVNHIAKVVMIVAAFYVLLTIFLSVYVPPTLLVGAFAGGLLTYWLNRKGYHLSAKVFGLLTINCVVFLATTSESSDTSIFLYFGSTGLVGLFIFGHEERWNGIAFVALSAGLYLLTRFTDVQFLPYRDFTYEQIQTFFVINVCVFSYVSSYIVFVMLRTNYESEKELKKINKHIREQNEKLVKANAELDSFMYSASHDMRAPLSSISGLIRLSEISTDHSEIHEYMGLMKGSIKNLEKFTRDITDHYRNSYTKTKNEEFCLKPFLQDIINNLTFAVNAEGINFILEVDEDVKLYTDATRLSVVLSNLLDNSIKYHDSQKPNAIIKIIYSKKENTHRITVEDNGQGIEPQHVDKIFDMFYRATHRAKGSGLGLYIVKETISKLNGQITVRSTFGTGSQFHLAFPVLKPNKETALFAFF